MSQPDEYTMPIESDGLLWGFEQDADLPFFPPPDPDLFFKEDFESPELGAAAPQFLTSPRTLSTESSEDPNTSEYSFSAFSAFSSPVSFDVPTPFDSDNHNEFGPASDLLTAFLDSIGQLQPAPAFFPHVHAVEDRYDNGTGQPVCIAPSDSLSAAATSVSDSPPPTTPAVVPVFFAPSDSLSAAAAFVSGSPPPTTPTIAPVLFVSIVPAHTGPIRTRTKPFACPQCGHGK